MASRHALFSVPSIGNRGVEVTVQGVPLLGPDWVAIATVVVGAVLVGIVDVGVVNR